MPKQEQEYLTCYNRYADAIFRHCYYRVYDRERALELTQETFTRTWQQIVNGVHIKNIRAFLYRVANNLVIDESRKRKSVSLEEMQSRGFDPAISEVGTIESRLDADFVLRMFDRLDEKYREVLLLRYMDQLSPRDIADILNISANVVSVRIHRGIQQIKKLLKSDENI